MTAAQIFGWVLVAIVVLFSLGSIFLVLFEVRRGTLRGQRTDNGHLRVYTPPPPVRVVGPRLCSCTDADTGERLGPWRPDRQGRCALCGGVARY